MALGPIDSHAHLTNLQNQGKSIDNAMSKGLTGIFTVSTRISEFPETLKLGEIHQGFIYPALGIHPTEFLDQVLEKSLKLIESNYKKIFAIGEIGLDYWFKPVRKDKVKKDKQIDFYEAQLLLARDLDLPVVIHSRGAWSDCITLANEYEISKGVFHWYSGPIDVLNSIIESGFYVSCTPAIDYSSELREAMKIAPIDRILVETDSPVWMKKLNRPAEPSDVILTVNHLATLKGLSVDEIISITNQNVHNLFRI